MPRREAVAGTLCRRCEGGAVTSTWGCMQSWSVYKLPIGMEQEVSWA